jgi:hypothetical protein
LVRGRQVDATSLASLANWFPVAVGGSPATVWWRFMGDKRLTAAFFMDSLQSQPPEDRLVCQTPLSALERFVGSVQPTVFIFHVSRCGSTLLTQMLATLPQCIVLSEPPVLDAFFRLLHSQPELPGAQDIFRKLVSALGQRRQGGEPHLFLKLDSWHTPWMPWLRKVYPDTPFIFLYREPSEVLASHRRQRGPQMVPGLLDTSLLQPDTTGLAAHDLEGYGASVLDAIFKSAFDALASAEHAVHAELVNYKQLPHVLWTRLLPLFSMSCEGDALGAVQARSRFHSKHGGQNFEGDPAPIHAKPPADETAHGTLAQRCYGLLETIRRS